MRIYVCAYTLTSVFACACSDLVEQVQSGASTVGGVIGWWRVQLVASTAASIVGGVFSWWRVQLVACSEQVQLVASTAASTEGGK